ncbi:MAG: dirigent protein [Actinomycetes bacterium]
MSVRPLLAALLLAGVAAAPASAAAHRKSLVITVKALPIMAVQHDRAPKGLSKGDLFTGRDRLTNMAAQFGKKTGAAVGSDRWTLALTSSSAGVLAGTATFPGGTVSFKGPGRLGAVARIPVTGGTGAFAGAQGSMLAGTGQTPLNTYTLTLP